MQRIRVDPRPDWQRIVESQEFIFHSLDDVPYWDESAYYLFSATEVDVIELAANELHERCLDAAQHIIDTGRYKDLGIPDFAIPLIEQAWEEEPPSVYGRFDFAYDGVSPPKLLEYNADTPTSLLEASVIQWFWLQDVFPKLDQFNSIHEKLLARWAEVKSELKGDILHFASTRDIEDIITANYLRDTAEASNIATDYLHVDEIGWDALALRYVDTKNRPIQSIFKLYPWEWLTREEYHQYLAFTSKHMRWIEPIWKMLLSNKAILPVLWELFPDHPNLLPAYLDGPNGLSNYVVKPKLAREGANLTVVKEDKILEKTAGAYDESDVVWQGLSELPSFDGARPVIGAWVIGGWAAGMGIREATQCVTTNLSRFVPHAFEPLKE
jgi:glutathionylspermidine synthase